MDYSESRFLHSRNVGAYSFQVDALYDDLDRWVGYTLWVMRRGPLGGWDTVSNFTCRNASQLQTYLETDETWPDAEASAFAVAAVKAREKADHPASKGLS